MRQFEFNYQPCRNYFSVLFFFLFFFLQFRENKCKIKIHRESTIDEILKVEQCSRSSDKFERAYNFLDDDFPFEIDTTSSNTNDRSKRGPYDFNHSNLSFESSTIARKRTVRRGDIGIQSLDEKSEFNRTIINVCVIFIVSFVFVIVAFQFVLRMGNWRKHWTNLFKLRRKFGENSRWT